MTGTMSDTTTRRPQLWVSSQMSHPGMVRENNEDALISRPEIGFWAVADGMGGHQVGDVASRMIIEALAHVTGAPRLADFVELVEARLLEANRDILEYASVMFEGGATMGSTLVSLLIAGQVGACLWAGDSRLYRLRAGQLTQLSRDHSHVQDLITLGLLDEADAIGHPQGNVITRAVGVERDVRLDLNVFNTQPGDTFLLCTDGLHNVVSAARIAELLSLPSAELATERLLQAALAAGAPDNVSAIVIKGGGAAR